LPEHLITLDSLRFGWRGQPAPLLQIERLNVARGERLFLHGASGSGKSTLLGLIAGVLMTSINERRREMAILRAMGARPGHVLTLMLGEAMVITLSGIGLGILLVSGIFLLGQDWIARKFGLFVELNLFTPTRVYVLIAIALFGCLIGVIPGIRMYRYALLDGMTVRV